MGFLMYDDFIKGGKIFNRWELAVKAAIDDNYTKILELSEGRSVTWAQLLALQSAGDVSTGDKFIITDQSNEEILITHKSPDGNTWFSRRDNAGVETVYKVE